MTTKNKSISMGAIGASASLPPTLEQSAEARHQTQILVKLNNAKTYLLNLQWPKLSASTNSTVPGTANKSHTEKIINEVMSQLSHRVKVPMHMLRLHNFNLHLLLPNRNEEKVLFISAYTFVPILGGKGGFGTLLKGQSKQAGARQTTDFGACRDLNGRRLRHVNDEIKLRQWRESMQRRAKIQAEQIQGKNGNVDNYQPIEVEKEIEELKTASGIRNWHLMVPSWGAGEMSRKSQRKEEMKLRKEIERWAREENEIIRRKVKKKRERERVALDYAKQGIVNEEEEGDEKLNRSILEGMRKRRKLQEKQRVDGNGDDDDLGNGKHFSNLDELISLLSASSLCTLSGDIVVEEANERFNEQSTKDSKSNESVQFTKRVQSKSEFATAAILINPDKFEECKRMPNIKGLYYEVTIETAGIAQIGWAAIDIDNLALNKGGQIIASMGGSESRGFLPNSNSGDGVGDDAYSYGYDGCRGRIFHNGKESAYFIGSNVVDKNEFPCGWKKGDVIGFLYDFLNGLITFSVNGHEKEIAFGSSTDDGTRIALKGKLLYPVLSLNEDEIVGLNIGPSFHYCPQDFRGISELINVKSGTSTDEDLGGEPRKQEKRLKKKRTDAAATEGFVAPCTESSSATFARQKGVSADKKKSAAEPSARLEPIDLETFISSSDLEQLGMDRLKEELYRLGCKCGGSLRERAQRLFSLKGLSRDKIPKKIRGGKFK